jgi:SAM-dependent methyltransferase
MKLNEIKSAVDGLSLDEINELKAHMDFSEIKELVKSPLWPSAVPEELICKAESEEDKQERAEGIIYLMINEDLSNKRFLDFGCGEGHVVFQAAKNNVEKSVGYDPHSSLPDSDDKCYFSNDFEKVREQGPFDIVLMYDVLDHLDGIDSSVDDAEMGHRMAKVLSQVKLVTHENSKIYLRCHPWCSRHGGHLYNSLNKAFAHVVFSKSELEDMGYEVEGVAKVTFPRATYDAAIENAGLKAISQDIIQTKAEGFFKEGLIAERIVSHWPEDKNKFPDYQVSQDFLDYILSH